MELKGKIISVLPLSTGTSAKGPWKKQEYILQTIETYPKKVCFNVWGDRIDEFALKAGDSVEVSFDLESREFNGRWYTDVKAWKVVKEAKGEASGQFESQPPLPPVPPDPDDMLPAGEEGDDLPF
jgi:hypothetical protein